MFHRVVRFDGFGLDDHRRVASGEGAAFGGDGSGDIAGRQSERHGDSRGDGQRQNPPPFVFSSMNDSSCSYSSAPSGNGKVKTEN